MTVAKDESLYPEGVVHTGSISSSVDLDFEHNLAHKVYHPKRYVRLLYWLAFQAPFPYVENHAALEAARQRRIIVDLLARFWFGHDLVADVVDVQDVPSGGHDFVTELVRGAEPPHKKQVWRFLKQLDEKFLEAGLPTWQVTPYNPHAITNFIETREGTYRIIDLESSLVAFLYPVSAIPRLVREGIFPSFDDIDVKRLRAYVTRNSAEITEALDEGHAQLIEAIGRYETAADQWHTAEPRYLTRCLRATLRVLETPRRWLA
ncbi:MAG TPA: hypothetical protein VI876_09600 [Dehalococcoidia bacterium]|nr:hypothetical protein [Dehalococcoidia bacterium]